jgi:Tol biopolymer transport system component
VREPSDDTRSSAKPPADQLNSWKDIAAYFNRDVTTVQRWEKREGMPVHRHLHDKIGSIYAFRLELDTWARSRNLKPNQEIARLTVSDEPVISPEPAIPQPSNRRDSFLVRTLVLVTVGTALAIGATLLLHETDYFWHNPIEGARFQTITDFDGVSRDAALSRDGHLVAFLSDHDGPMDVWVSQVGSGQFHNLTRGSVSEVVNPFVRTLGFSADSSLITFWVRKSTGPGRGIGIWAVPTLGGQPQPYLDGAAEFDLSRDGSRLAYHTPGPGDPLFVSDGLKRPDSHPIFTAPAGLHSHFPLWSPDTRFIYFVQGSLSDNLDIWRIGAKGGSAERITSHFGFVSHPVLLDNRTLIYLANDPDRSGP